MISNIKLVIIDPTITGHIIVDRIKALGRTYQFWKNHWLVDTSLDTKQIYEKLSEGKYSKTSMFIVEVPKQYSGTNGRMKNSLWQWLTDVKLKDM
ncbi:MAG: hypothetical protein K5854_06265 [Prevotella sp.]|jgi:hypothetical protein|nr:hypothetical protein [Prevotella sp.]